MHPNGNRGNRWGGRTCAPRRGRGAHDPGLLLAQSATDSDYEQEPDRTAARGIPRNELPGNRAEPGLTAAKTAYGRRHALAMASIAPYGSDNRVALITGGKRIGGVVAESWPARGRHRAGLPSSRAEAEETAAAVRGTGARQSCMQGDLRDPDACARVVDETVDALGRLDILVNMASVYRSKPFDELT